MVNRFKEGDRVTWVRNNAEGDFYGIYSRLMGSSGILDSSGVRVHQGYEYMVRFNDEPGCPWLILDSMIELEASPW